jgi:hypothetical protein
MDEPVNGLVNEWMLVAEEKQTELAGLTKQED